MPTPAVAPPADGPALGTPPSTANPANFDANGDAFLGQLPQFQTDENLLKANVYANAQAAHANALLTAADAVSTAANTALAAGYAGAAPWVSGSTVAQYTVVSSPANGRLYRKLTTSTGGTTDPSLDPTNYGLIDLNRPIVQVNAATYTAVAGLHYEIIYAGVCTLSLPATPGNNNAVEVTSSNGYTNVLARNGSTIEALAEDMDLDTHHLIAKYSTSTWRVSQ